MNLRPFWCYYGGKWRAAPHYPIPIHPHIIEPFAGAAGYALRYPHLQVTLVERYRVVADLWRWLIEAYPSDVMAIPIVDDVRDLPSNVHQSARSLVGFAMNAATTAPRVTLSAGARRLRGTEYGSKASRRMAGWTPERRALVASQVAAIKHWKIIEGDYSSAPDVAATWFVDPPYTGEKGAHYMAAVDDYRALATWCRARQGQVIVCENEGADWLPFTTFKLLKAGVNGTGSREVVWTKGDESLFSRMVQVSP